MSVEDKLDKIIELLTSIDLKLSNEQAPKASNVELKKVHRKLTAEQSRFKRAVEFTLSQEAKFFIRSCKKEIRRILEIRKTETDWMPIFNDTQAYRWAIERAARYPNSPFYQDILKYSESFVKSTNEQVLLIIKKSQA
jgi:hypothetical protein